MTRASVLALRSVFALALLPLAVGALVVTYQDAVMTHLPARAAQVAQVRAGEFPFLHPYQSCGEPLAGNPNFGTFFPDTLLFLVLPLGTAFGLRFALAAVLAFAGARRWARAEGAPRFAAEASGYAFALSGVFVSAWRFYNTGLALALAPFVLAAVARACRLAGQGRPLRRVTAEIALCAALEVLAGEPVVALLTAVAVAVRIGSFAIDEEGRKVLVPLARATAGGGALALLIAAPQLAATWQSYPGSSRDAAPFSFAAATGTSVHAARVLEQAAPFPFGRPDLTGPLGFHGHRSYDNHSPYLWTLHLGWAVLALLLRQGRPLAPGERAWWAAAVVAVVLSLGYHLPAARALSEVLSLGGRVRFPVKWWYLVALALVVPVSRAASRLAEAAPWSRGRAIAAVAAAIVIAAALTQVDLRTPLAIAAVVVSAAAVAVLAAPRLASRPEAPALAIAASLAVAHLPLPLAFLDRMPAPPPPLAGGRVYERLRVDAHPPDAPERGPTREVFRRATAELWAVSGGIGGIGYAFDRDPDGSYADVDRAARKAVDDLPWPERAPALRAAGVRYVVGDERLEPPYRAVWAHGDATLYELDAPAPSVRASVGTVSGVRERVARLEAAVDADAPTVVVWSRTFFPAWRAAVDGAPVAPVLAEDHLVGVPVPPGTHRVEVWWPAAPVLVGSGLGLIGALVAATMARGGRQVRS